MSAADVLHGLLEAAIATGVALVVILSLRWPLRRYFGANVAYHVWILLPAALIATWLPTPHAPMPMLVMAPVHATAERIATVTHAPAAQFWLLVFWLAGGLATAALLWRQQRKFMRALGPVVRTPRGDWRALRTTAGLPAALGMLRPRIVLPADFETRYTSEQQVLMRCHERNHLMRGDLHMNAAFALLRCVFWFNPLMHCAMRAFRHDQELACDARVIARHAHARRAYGEAMLKTQLAAQPLPLACQWGYGHPLKERIEMLKQPLPSLPRWIGGSSIVVVLAIATAFASWAAQPAADAVADSGQASRPASDAAPDAASTRTPPPRYPKAAADQGIGGWVVLIVDFDATGVPTAIEVERSEPAGVFDAATLAAAWQWRFRPEIRNGRAVPGRVRVPVQFEPRDSSPPGGSA